jgi:hypothetical protein
MRASRTYGSVRGALSNGRPYRDVLWTAGRCSREFGMKWRVMLELVGPDGIVGVHEVGGRAAVPEYAPRLIGLTLEEGKHLLAALQVHLVQAQAEDHCRRRRRCQRCGAQRPLKDQRSRRLVSLFGTVEVRAPRFAPCRCAVTCRRRSTRLPKSYGSAQNVGDQAVSGNCWTVLEVGSHSLPKPDPNAPL